MFDTLHHARLALKNVYDGSREFDVSDGGLTISFQEAWDEFRLDDWSHFLNMPILVTVALMTTMFVLHMFVSSTVVHYMERPARSNVISDKVLQGFHSILSPPLHLDWEYYYRNRQRDDTVVKCWEKYV